MLHLSYSIGWDRRWYTCSLATWENKSLWIQWANGHDIIKIGCILHFSYICVISRIKINSRQYHFTGWFFFLCGCVRVRENGKRESKHLSSLRNSKSSGLMDDQGSKVSQTANRSDREQAKRESRVQKVRAEIRQSSETGDNAGNPGKTHETIWQRTEEMGRYIHWVTGHW